VLTNLSISLIAVTFHYFFSSDEDDLVLQLGGVVLPVCLLNRPEAM
jgi:hypothetical protein